MTYTLKDLPADLPDSSTPTQETPMNDSEKELLKAWLEAAGADGQDHDYMHRERLEFFRVLRTVKAETWTDGYLAAHWDLEDDTETPNPYEEEGTVSTWSERAHRSAEALDMEALEATDPEDVQYGFREGARWQREALLSDETVERAARALYAEDVNESTDTPWPDYDSPKNVGRPLYEERARNALLAAIGDDDETPNPYEEEGTVSGNERSRAMSDYTPTVGELRQAYVEASGASMAQESYYAEQVAEFERGIARVKAEALRDARDNVRASSFWADGSDNYADRVRGYLSREAKRIEDEGL